MGSKKGGDGGAAASRQATADAIGALQEGKSQGVHFLNIGERDSLVDVDRLMPQARQITSNAFNNLANYENNVANEVNRVDQAYLAPSQRATSEQFKNLFSRYGVGGTNNSKVQNVINRLGEEFSFNEAARRLNLEDNVRNRYLGEQTNLYNVGTQPINQRIGTIQDFAKAKANTVIGSASQLGNTYMQGGQALAQAQQNAAAQRQSSKGTAIGAGVGLAGGVLGAFSDERLKENIRPVGKLDNGLTVYIYNFKGSDKSEIGLIAQEVEKLKPEAVKVDKTGFKKVNYKEAVA